MKIKDEMNVRNICFGIIILICIIALVYAVYYQVFIKNAPPKEPEIPMEIEDVDFAELFDNEMHLQNYNSAGFAVKMEPTKEIIYNAYTFNEAFEDKYEIQANIPMVNVNNEKIVNIDKEIVAVFYDKINNIIEGAKQKDFKKTIYTVSYTGYLNENILSLVIRATLKEGDSAQRVIIKGYNYNLSTNQEVPLKDMLEIKGINAVAVETEITNTIQKAINYSNNMASLGYPVYKRNIKDEMYKVENSNNYVMGPNGSIYIIYAYGNADFTSENDVVYIKPN